MAVHRRLEVSEVGAVTVVRFVDRKILDAANIQEFSAMGTVSYTTSTSVPETATFYEEQFAALGAQVVPQMPTTDSMASPMFLLDDLPIVLTITAQGDGSTSVSITIMGNNPFRGAAPLRLERVLRCGY